MRGSGRPSIGTALRQKELEGIRVALEELKGAEDDSVRMEGLTRANFGVGVLNLVLCVYVFAKWPEHCWLLYALESGTMICLWWHTVSTKENGVFFMMDFCWGGSAFFAFYMFTLLLDVFPVAFRHSVFVAFYGSAMGPMLWAALLLNSGLVFHSVTSSASLFIHVFPSWVVYAVNTYPDKFAEAWPRRFPTTAEWEATSMREVWLTGAAFYFTWWLLHATWLLTIGVDLPKRGYATVFDNCYRTANLGAKFEKITGSSNIRVHALIYLLLHALASQTGYMFSTWTWRWWWIHPAFGFFVFLNVVKNGSSHYDFLFSKKYTLILEKLLKDRETEQSKKAS